MKTNELTGAALDWAVAKCEADNPMVYMRWYTDGRPDQPHYGISGSSEPFNPSIDWAQGGPIIEREGILLDQYHDFPNWAASCPPKSGFNRFGPTPLIAAMRCYVASKLGDTVEVPIELN